MSTEVLTRLRCDTRNCTRRYPVRMSETVKEARARAELDGWISGRIGRSPADWCPWHKLQKEPNR